MKLGTVLYDHTANEDKKARMEKVARETTSWEAGVRLTGFSVCTSLVLDTDVLLLTPSRL